MRPLLVAMLLAPSVAFAALPDPGAPWPAGTLWTDQVAVGFTLVHVDPATARRAPEVLARLVRKHLPGFTARAFQKDEPPRPRALRWMGGREDAWPEEELQLFASKVDPALRAKLTARHPVTEVMAVGSSEKAATLRGLMALTGAAARELGAVVHDPETRELLDVPAFEAMRGRAFAGPVPAAPELVVIHAYRQGAGLRSVSLGMSKLGLPDVVVNGHTHGDGRSVGWLVNAVCQWMVENGALPTPGRIPLDFRKLRPTPLRERLLANPKRGATGAAEVGVAVGRREEGDAENALMELTFAGFPGGPTERQDALLARLFGAEDEISYAPHDDAALEAASRRARKALPGFKAAFARHPERERFVVKAPFRAPDRGVEYMWVEIRSWEGDRIRGILVSDPELVKDLRAGAVVTVEEGEVYDWMREYPDGRTEGNETSKVLLEREHGR